MKSLQKIALVVLAATALQQCSTDLEINAPYKEITTIYGLLNKNESVHLVKINKAFLGEGNAFDMAMVRDSSEYTTELNAVVERIENGSVTATYPLNDTVVTDREPGVFYHPEQTLYFFAATLDQGSEYRVRCVFPDRSVTASTVLVNDFSINPFNSNAQLEVDLGSEVNGYRTYEFKWRQGLHGKRYTCYYRFNYREEYNGSPAVERSLTRRMATRIAANSQIMPGQAPEMAATLNGQTFAQEIGNSIDDDPSVTQRVIQGIDFIVEVANDDLHTYLQLNEPVTGIVEDRAPFSNVENGFGLFASRADTLIAKSLRDITKQELIDGPYTAHLNFSF